MLDLRERLRRQAQQTSDISREMAEAKSLRQADNPEGRKDLYSWPTPEQTTEGLALAEIERLHAVLKAVDDVLCEVSGHRPKQEPQLFVDALVKIEDLVRPVLKDAP